MLEPTALAPYRIVEVIDRAFRIYRDNFVTFIALVAVVIAPITLMGLWVNDNLIDDRRQQATTLALSDSAPTWIMITLIGLFLRAVFIGGPVTYIASENYLGRRVSIITALSEVKARLGVLAVGLVVFGLFFGLAAVGITFLATILIGLFLVPVLIYVGLALYFFVVPVLTLENVGVGRGLRRALLLGKIRFWRAFRLALGISLITFLINLAFSTFTPLLLGLDSSDSNVIERLVDLGVSIFLAPILPIGLTLLYYDTRIRTEGLDIALQTLDKPDPRPRDVISPPAKGPLLNRTDFKNMFLLVAGMIGIVCGPLFLFGLLLNIFF